MLLSLLAGEGFGEDGVLLSEGETVVVLVIDVVELADAGAFADIAIGVCTRREFCAGEIADCGVPYGDCRCECGEPLRGLGCRLLMVLRICDGARDTERLLAIDAVLPVR